jgi:hemoglobin
VTDAQSLYEAVGGQDTFVRLVDRFYVGVATDPVLRAMYPADLGPARERMTAFLTQYWGGPRAYSDLRGHPRLRKRHAAFRMDADTRTRWLAHMRTASTSCSCLPIPKRSCGSTSSGPPSVSPRPRPEPALSGRRAAVAELDGRRARGVMPRVYPAASCAESGGHRLAVTGRSYDESSRDRW